MTERTQGTEKEKLLKQVYLIYGQEKLLLEEALGRLKARVAKQTDLNLNYSEFRGGEDEAKEIINACNTFPFASGKRLVVVKDADKLSPSDLSVLVDYARSPVEQTCLVLVAGKLKKTSRLYKSFLKKGEVYEYEAPKPYDCPVWIKEEFAKRGKKATDALARYLYLTVGTELSRLRDEIAKLCLFYDEQEEIDVEEARMIVQRSADASVFDLVDLLGRRQKTKAIETLRNLLDGGEDPLRIFYMIARQLRLLINTKALLQEGISDKKLATKLGLPSFVVSQYKKQSQRFSIRQLKKGLELLLETDLALKTSPQEKGQLLEILIHKLLMT